MPSRRHQITFPDDMWAAVEIAAQKDGMTRGEIVRIGTLSYVAFMAARRGDQASGGFDDLWEAARRLVELYPL
jgi:hypothetical protein